MKNFYTNFSEEHITFGNKMDMFDLKVPRNHWIVLSNEDKKTFKDLHLHFIKQQKENMKERKNNSFFTDIQCLIQYIEYTPLQKDDRAICVGLACSGPFICVNTQQVKIILGRCKSSINNNFQQIGYESVKTKAKAHEAALTIIPALVNEQNTLRKWTVRCATDKSMACFVSKYIIPSLPTIEFDDIYDPKVVRREINNQSKIESYIMALDSCDPEIKSDPNNIEIQNNTNQSKNTNSEERGVFDSIFFNENEENDDSSFIFEFDLTPSLSVDYLSQYGLINNETRQDKSILEQSALIPRSQSFNAYFGEVTF